MQSVHIVVPSIATPFWRKLSIGSATARTTIRRPAGIALCCLTGFYMLYGKLAFGEPLIKSHRLQINLWSTVETWGTSNGGNYISIIIIILLLNRITMRVVASRVRRPRSVANVMIRPLAWFTRAGQCYVPRRCWTTTEWYSAGLFDYLVPWIRIVIRLSVLSLSLRFSLSQLANVHQSSKLPEWKKQQYISSHIIVYLFWRKLSELRDTLLCMHDNTP